MRLIFLYISVLHVLQKPLEALLAHTYTTNMKIVGHANRHEIELNPQEAWRRARLMDAMFQSLYPPHPRGITRETHAEFQRRDEARMLEIARRLNPS